MSEEQGTKGECKEKAVQSLGCVKKWGRKRNILAAATEAKAENKVARCLSPT